MLFSAVVVLDWIRSKAFETEPTTPTPASGPTPTPNPDPPTYSATIPFTAVNSEPETTTIKKKRRNDAKEHTLLAPVMNERVKIEYSVHKMQPRMKPDMERCFPGEDLANLLIIPTFQQCKCDLVADGPGPAAEKDALLESFMAWAQEICQELRDEGHWADLTDPCSGYPVFGDRGPGWYPDVIGGQMLLRYDLINTGCCKLLSHPKWTTKVYPATLFTTAPAEILYPKLSK